MKALIIDGPNQPFVMRERPDPVAGPGEAVARIHACGAGLTIQHVKTGHAPAEFPIVLGHELTGEIVDVGEQPGAALVEPLKVGDAVTCWFYLIEGEDRWTRSDRPTVSRCFKGHVGRQVDGAYAEYIKLPVLNFIKLPAALDWRRHPAEAGVVCDALATPYKVIRHGRIRPHDVVAVFGAGGGLGLHQVMMCKWARARTIAVDIDGGKLAACRQAGADAVVDAGREDVVEALRDFSGGGVDVAIDYVSSTRTLEQAVGALGIGGRLLTLGGSGQDFKVSARQMMAKELELLGSRYCTRQEVIETLDLVARGQVWPVVTETVPFEAGAVEAMHERIEGGLVTGRAAVLMP